MTEYWVSQARHWCEYCKIFINGSKPSIAFHENGRKHKEIVELLIAKGANVHHADKRGKTALDYAKMHKQFHITKMLAPLMKQDATRKMQMLTLDGDEADEDAVPRSSEQVPGLAGSDADLR